MNIIKDSDFKQWLVSFKLRISSTQNIRFELYEKI